MRAGSKATVFDEGERLMAAERDAAKRYYDALEKSDLREAKAAAAALAQAGDAYGEYLEDLYPNRGSC